MRSAPTKTTLMHHARTIAEKARIELAEVGISPLDHPRTAQHFGLKFSRASLALGVDGQYVEDGQVIRITNRRLNAERDNFTFLHELLHALLKRSDDFISNLHEIPSTGEEIDTLLERCCDAGAAEVLLPSKEIAPEIEAKGLSTRLIPELSSRYGASATACAFQIVSLADVPAHLLIVASKKWVNVREDEQEKSKSTGFDAQLAVEFVGYSPTAHGQIKKGVLLPIDHPLYAAKRYENDSYNEHVWVTFADGTQRYVNCDALTINSRIFAILTAD